jgi:flagellum-specific ATP synthase
MADKETKKPINDFLLDRLSGEGKHFFESLPMENYYQALSKTESTALTYKGRVRSINGMVIRAQLPNAHLGELCYIEPKGRKPVLAQVVGFDDEDIFLTPFDSLEAVGPKSTVVSRGDALQIGVSEELLGRVVDSLGVPIDGGPEIKFKTFYPALAAPPESMKRQRIKEALPTGVRAVDLLLTVGKGQRLGVFSAAGVGKSSLLGMIARNSSADVNIVSLVGERGREVLDFIEESLGPEGLKKSIVVVSTSDETPLRRITAGYTAMAMAEYFRDQGQDVMLFMDSVTRFARALREIALSIGEAPARQGYPPSVFATLPKLLERAGNTEKGSITGIYTVLLSGEQLEDPLGEEVRAILDGHLYLNSKLSNLQHYPAIDLMASNSRVMDAVVDKDHLEVAQRLRRIWACYEENRDLISLGAYKKGSDPEIDEAIQKRAEISKVLIQKPTEKSSVQEALALAKKVL